MFDVRTRTKVSSDERGSDQDQDVLLTLRVQVVGKVRQASKVDLIVGEVFLVLHVIDVRVLNVLQKKRHFEVCPVKGQLFVLELQLLDQSSGTIISMSVCSPAGVCSSRADGLDRRLCQTLALMGLSSRRTREDVLTSSVLHRRVSKCVLGEPCPPGDMSTPASAAGLGEETRARLQMRGSSERQQSQAEVKGGRETVSTGNVKRIDISQELWKGNLLIADFKVRSGWTGHWRSESRLVFDEHEHSEVLGNQLSLD